MEPGYLLLICIHDQRTTVCKKVAMDLVKLASWCCFVLQLIKVSLRKKVFVLSSQAEPHETTGELPNTRFHPCRVFSCGA